MAPRFAPFRDWELGIGAFLHNLVRTEIRLPIFAFGTALGYTGEEVRSVPFVMQSIWVKVTFPER
jgi:hypothetical protein